MSTRGPQLLLVEDNEDDVFLMRRALRASTGNVSLHVVSDGQEALDYLQGAGQYADRDLYPPPDLVFLDLKLPYVHGFEVLEWVQSNAPHLAVIVLTSSPEERDRGKAERLGARSYMVKPPTPSMVQSALEHLAEATAKF